MNINLDNPRSLFARLVLCLACGLILAIGNAGLLRAQSDSQEQQKQEPEKKEAQTPPAAAVSPSEGFRFGVYQGHSDIEIGYRWVSDTAGSKEMYRSMVNLGEGPRVLHSSISLRSDYGSGILFDHLDLSFDSWGGDPYNTMRLNFGRSGAYEFSANYRNLIYYNFVPTWANPLIATGYLVDQHAEHVDFRGTDIELKFFTSRRIRPYVAYSRSSGFGPGLTTFSLTGNEFVLGTQWHYSSDDYRGGVEFVLPRLNLTLEEGYRFLKNDTSVNQDSSPQGNTPVPFLGNPVVLNALGRGYHDRTTLPVSKAVVKFTPFDNLKITGRYIYTMSDLQSTMGEIDTGSLVSIENRLVYSASSDAFNTRAKQPNHNGSFLIEYSPFSRLTFLDQFETRSYHVSGDALLASVFLNASSLLGPSGKSNVKVSNILGSLLAYDQLSNQAELEYDLGQGFTLRGGHRYTYAEATLQSSENGSSDSSTANFGQHTGIAGVGFARGQWLNLTLDYEKNLANRALVRTDLLDYDQFKFDWKVRPWKSVSLNGRVAFLRNTNDQSDIDLKAHNRNYTVALEYEPNERFSMSLDYSRTNILSDLAILLPQTLQLDRSLFDERGQAVGGSFAVAVYRGSKVEFGYHGILNIGSFPLNYHQPFAAVTIPLPEHMAFRTYWQYYGYNEIGSNLQDNRTHLVTISLAYQR